MNQESHEQVLAEVRQEIGDLEGRIRRLRAVEEYLVEKTGGPNGEAAPVVQTPTTERPAEHGQRPYAEMPAHEAAVAVLRQTGKPLSTRDIAARMLAGGFRTKSPKRLRNSVFGVMDLKKNVFYKAGVGMWGLVEWESRREAEPEQEE